MNFACWNFECRSGFGSKVWSIKSTTAALGASSAAPMGMAEPFPCVDAEAVKQKPLEEVREEEETNEMALHDRVAAAPVEVQEEPSLPSIAPTEINMQEIFTDAEAQGLRPAHGARLKAHGSLCARISCRTSWLVRHAELRGTGSKRGAEESTPDREASARAKVAKDLTPCSLESVALAPSSSARVETSTVEMSAANILTLRTMMREELSNTLGEVESRITANVAATMEELQQEFKKERAARAKLEQRIQKLEQGHVEEGRVEKEKVIIKGFVDMDNEEAEKLWTDVLCDVPGFQFAYATTPTLAVAFAQFDTAVNAMKFMRSQKQNEENVADDPLPPATNDAGLVSTKVHVTTQNLQSIRDHERFQDFVSELSDASFDVLFVTETWRGERQELFTTTHGHALFLSGGEGCRGVGIVLTIVEHPSANGSATYLTEIFSGNAAQVNRPNRTLDEVQHAVAKLKSNKAADGCGLVAELLKHAPPEFLMVMVDLFNHVLFHGDAPVTWRKSFSTCFRKNIVLL
eukprot:s1031_g14.t1